MPRASPQVYLRRRIIALGGLFALLVLGFYLPVTLLAPLGEAAAVAVDHVAQRQAPPVVSYPPFGASAFGAVGYEGVLGEAGSTGQFPIASISKVVTALVVLDAFPLAPGDEGPMITFDEVDADYFAEQRAINGTRQPVTVGGSLSEHDALELMLIPSANNYALSLARWAFGTPEGFIAATTDWLSDHGLTATVVREPTGLDAGNLSTPADLVEIGRLAIEHPVVAAIVGTPATEVPGIGIVENRNVLLGVDGIDGIKTGTLEETGANLLFSAEHTVGSEVITIIGVVLGGPDQATVRESVRGILASAAVGFREVTLADQGQEWGAFSTAWGDTAEAVVRQPLRAVVWDGAEVQSSVDLEPVRLGEAGTDVGDLTFTVGERTFTTDLVLEATIDDPGPWWRLSHPLQLF